MARIGVLLVLGTIPPGKLEGEPKDVDIATKVTRAELVHVIKNVYAQGLVV
jgi:hypothetical protein